MALTKDWRQRTGTLFETEKQGVVGSCGVVTANHPLGAGVRTDVGLGRQCPLPPSLPLMSSSR